MKEIWKPIKNYENLYLISNKGNVKSLIKNKILKYNLWNGYPVVQLSKNKERHTFQIHRLVAEAFIPNPNNYPFVNHKNENSKDFNIRNLEWCTQKMNINYSKRKMYHPANFIDFYTDKYIYKKKCKTIKNDKEYSYIFYRVSIPKIKIDKVFSNYEKAIKFRNMCLPLMQEYYIKKQKEFALPK